MKALVTGASGFIGSHLVEHLKTQGWDVHLILRPNSRRKPESFRSVTTHSYAELSQIEPIVAQVKPDVTFHLASLFLAQHKHADVSPLCESNVTFSTVLVDALVQHACWNFVSAGTAWQNFEGKKGTAVCLYAATKEAFEAILRYYADATPLRATVLKIYDTYGPKDPRNKLLSVMRQSTKIGSPMSFPEGDQVLDMLHVQDAIAAFMVAAERLLKLSEGKGQLEEFYLRTNQALSLKALAHLFCTVNGVQLKAQWGARPYRPREVMKPWTEGATLPGWSPQISLEAGLKEFFEEEHS